jgi:spore coat polysaccharide biosynthesis protein SpsF (cytidylyltransferase family)
MAPKSEVGVSDSNFSAFAAMRELRDQLRVRLDQNEDYRAWKALDEALRDLEPRTLPQALDFALDSISDATGRRVELSSYSERRERA